MDVSVHDFSSGDTRGIGSMRGVGKEKGCAPAGTHPVSMDDAVLDQGETRRKNPALPMGTRWVNWLPFDVADPDTADHEAGMTVAEDSRR